MKPPPPQFAQCRAHNPIFESWDYSDISGGGTLKWKEKGPSSQLTVVTAKKNIPTHYSLPTNQRKIYDYTGLG